MDEALTELKQKASEQERSADEFGGSQTAAPAVDEQRTLEKSQRKKERFQKVKELRANGFSILQISKSLRMHRRTVRLYLQTEELPEQKKPLRFAELRKYLPYLEQRWANLPQI